MALTIPWPTRGDNGLFGGAADEAFEVGAHCYAGFNHQADTVFGHGVEHASGGFIGIGAVDDLRVHRWSARHP